MRMSRPTEECWINVFVGPRGARRLGPRCPSVQEALRDAHVRHFVFRQRAAYRIHVKLKDEIR